MLARELPATCPSLAGRRVEIVNFGVSGYGTSTEWIALQREGWAYQPDLVLLAFFSGNDLRNNVFELEQKPYRLYHRLREGRLEAYLPATPWRATVHGLGTRVWRGLAEWSRVVQALNQGRRALIEWRLRARGLAVTGEDASGVAEGIDTWVLRPPTPGVQADAWAVRTVELKKV